MQSFRNDVFSAPTSFFAFTALRHAVRLACFAAASLEGGKAAAAAAAGIAVPGALLPGATVPGASPWSAGGAAAKPHATGNKLRHTAVATAEKRMIDYLKTQSHRQALGESRIAPAHSRTDEAGMKLA
jgi:hypothetical protein